MTCEFARYCIKTEGNSEITFFIISHFPTLLVNPLLLPGLKLEAIQAVEMVSLHKHTHILNTDINPLHS
jgi:hypothetical protein